MREIPEVFRNFKSYKLTIQNRSLKTVEEYLLDLDLFFRYVIASREGIELEGEKFDSINISNIDLDFVKSVTTDEIYEFFRVNWRRKRKGISLECRKIYFRQIKFYGIIRVLLSDN